MNRFRRITTMLAMALFMAAAGGCPQDHTPPLGAKITAALPKPPAYPAAVNTPIDPQLRDAAIAVIQDAVQSDNRLLRAHGVEAIRDANLTGMEAELLKLMNDPEPIVRFAAAIGLGELKYAPAHKPLLILAADPDIEVRIAARFALHKLGDTRLSHDLEHTAVSTDPLVRGATAQVLGMLGDRTATGLLEKLRLDPAAAVRQQASEALWRLGNTEGRDDLVGLSISVHPDDEMIGLLGLAQRHDYSTRSVISGELVNGYPEVSLVAARAMGMLDSDEGYGVAMRGVKSANPLHRYLGALALGAIGRPDAQELLRPLLTDKAADVRLAAATAILELHEAAGTRPS